MRLDNENITSVHDNNVVLHKQIIYFISFDFFEHSR